MSELAQPLDQRRTWIQSFPIYYGWVNVIVASVAMTATLPGRTHGLGLVTESLLKDLDIDQVLFARINLVASLAGAAFGIPIGWLIDRFGVRSVLVAVTIALGLCVLGMSTSHGAASLLVWLILVRGFGQTALSVASMAAIGKWFSRRLGMAMGLFAVLLTFGFIASVVAMGSAVQDWGWRISWQYLGLAVLGCAPVFWLFARSTPELCGVVPDEPAPDDTGRAVASLNFTLKQALRTPAFWVVALGSSAFNLVWSGVTLFNESMLVERGLNSKHAVGIMAILTGIGLVANLVCGGLATRERVIRLLGIGLALLAGALALFPMIGGLAGARVYAAAIGFSGGIITVVFFAAWGHLFGQSQLGRIQGVAQFATVLASALGPELMAECRALTGSYSFIFFALATMIGGLAVAAMVVPLPSMPTSHQASDWQKPASGA